MSREEFKPHPSHDMTDWKNTIVTIVSTPRFGKFRKCRKCGAEEAKTVAGADHWDELERPCEGGDPCEDDE